MEEKKKHNLKRISGITFIVSLSLFVVAWVTFFTLGFFVDAEWFGRFTSAIFYLVITFLLISFIWWIITLFSDKNDN